MSFAEAFPASGFQQPLEAETLPTIYGRTCEELSSGCDPFGSWLRTSLAWTLTIPQENWKLSATRSGRSLWTLHHAGKDTAASGQSLLPTPTRTANQDAPSMRKWPTCAALQDEIGRLNPHLWEWQMGFPEGWTDCNF